MKGAGRPTVGAAGVAGVQVAAALGVQILWRHTAGMWGEVAMLSYFVAFGLLLPLLAFIVGRRLADRGRLSVLLAWPIVLANVIAAFAAHGFEEAGVGAAGMLVAFASVSFFAGWVALRHQAMPGASSTL